MSDRSATTTPLTGSTTPSRRTVLKMAGMAGGAAVSVSFVTACGSGEKGAAPAEDLTAVKAAVQKSVSAGEPAVGKAAFLKEEHVVITQPSAGQYTVFSSACPHQGADVTMLDDKSGRIVCVLHGSQFDPVSGAVVVGPSPAGLKKLDVPVTGPTAAG